MSASLSHHRNPLTLYDNGILYIEDSNPDLHVRWRMSRPQCFAFGLKCLWTAIRPIPTYSYAPGVDTKLRNRGQ